MSTVETVAAEAAAPALVLPHLFHPFDTPVHPDADRAEADLLAWMNGHGLLDDPRWANGIRHGKIGEYCSRVYAHATFDGLCTTTRAYGWIFAIDDGLCSLHGVARAPGDLGALYLWLYEMIADPTGRDPAPLRAALAARLPHMAAFLPALQRATQDVCARIAAASTRVQYARWVAGMMTFLFSTLWEAGRFATDVVPGEAEYLSGRTYNGCGEGAFALIDIAGGYEAPAAFYADEEVERLRKLSGLILCLCNDIFSYPKEAGESSSNLVCVLMHEHGLAPQAALDAAADIHNGYLARYLDLEKKVRTRTDDRASLRLLDEAHSYIRGNYDWHFGSPRYGAAKHYDLSRALRPGETSAAA
ncbi:MULTISPECIES: terpene synthase family protein [Burkholderia]|uniref:Terpene synthase n=1 Tax=Burkholderia cepacia TaxID=292 RepID=A0ABM6P0S1_BURCE|nr:terpene synthase [Burkholderia cepacia]AIO29781.1 terpene synthase family, metal binding domain protein [Burkholderia cepacia ATCC 25416]ALK21696.1 terpene synthase [Burkholderia cepacia ATCC 25416]ASE98228.1 terpene synthase [Burkholderia cepacia]ATF80799.1 terpene synthase [Burkholderia cepacia]MCA7896301.1 terpene synthase [Burkholderia cepacia]